MNIDRRLASVLGVLGEKGIDPKTLVGSRLSFTSEEAYMEGTVTGFTAHAISLNRQVQIFVSAPYFMGRELKYLYLDVGNQNWYAEVGFTELQRQNQFSGELKIFVE